MASACLAQVPPEFRLSPEAGFPRSWEAGVQVAPHSVLNLFNGNVATELVLHPFGGSGPAVRFAIVHNSASSDSEQTIPQPGGFSLGPGWGISFGTWTPFAIYPDSNSNGGIHKVARRCVGTNFPRPPLEWRRMAIGWDRSHFNDNNQTCDGY